MAIKKCSVCATEFTCGVMPPGKPCWCEGFPAVFPAAFAQDCRCKACLAKAIAERINDAVDTQHHRQMLVIAAQYRNPYSLIEHIDYTLESGKLIFSQWYHLKRGTCCGNGCKK